MVPQTSITDFSLSDISRIYSGHPGGFITLEYVPIDDVASIGDTAGMYDLDGYIRTITLKSGKTWFSAKVPAQQKSLSETLRTGDAGPYYEMLAEVFVPYRNDHTHTLLSRMVHYRYMCRILLPDGRYVVMGNLENPCRFEQNYDSGQNFKTVPGSRGRFTWQHPDKCPMTAP